MEPTAKARQTTDLRADNTATILSLLLKHDFISRQQLVRQSGLAASTVSTITGSLMDRGLIQRVGNMGTAGVGRKAELLARKPDAAYTAAVHFTPEAVRIGIVDLGYEMVVSRNLTFDGGFSDEQTQTVIEELRQLIVTTGLEGRLSAVGLALPNDPFDNDRIMREFRAAFEYPIVYINNVEAMAMCEYYFQLGTSLDTFIFVYVGTGIGSGFVIDGELYRGVTGRASDFGHTYITDQAVRCRCGRMGCLEAVASEHALARDLRAHYGELPPLTRSNLVSVLADLVRKEDAFAVELVAKAASYLGKGIFNLVSVLDPESVVVTGRINSMNPYFSNLVEQAYRQQMQSPSLQETPLHFIPLREDAGITGTAMFCFKTLFCGDLVSAAARK
jgi:predicted NBD/HSP70 family sugar kinase